LPKNHSPNFGRNAISPNNNDMRKIILNLAVSLDGYIEGPNGEYDWCLDDQDYGLTDFYNTIDAIFIGRKSYELISNEPNMFADKRIYVFSDTLSGDQPANVEIIAKQNYIERIHEIRSGPGLNIWLFGGAGLV
jgi:dihydrofolate reductase